MPIKQISPEEAKDLLDRGENHIYLDVRSAIEFEQGHPSAALNIPIKTFNQVRQMLEDNHEFIEVVEANIPKDVNLIIGCNSGLRSQVACEMLEQRGYENLANMQGGYGGARDMFGNIVQEGWAELGYGVESGSGEERSYASLKGKIKNS